MDKFYWTTDYEHCNNTQTLSEYLEDHLPKIFEVLVVDGSCAEITNTENGIVYGVHAQGDGDFYNHMVRFDELKTVEDITEDGEITKDLTTGEYTVWDETYTYKVCTTSYEKVAYAALQAYADNYLDYTGDIT